MENLSDYSRYVFVAYTITGVSLTLLMVFVVSKYSVLKNKIKNRKNEKSA